MYLQHHVAEAWPDGHILQQPLYIILQAQHDNRITALTHGHTLHVVSSTTPSMLCSADVHLDAFPDTSNLPTCCIRVTVCLVLDARWMIEGPWLPAGSS